MDPMQPRIGWLPCRSAAIGDHWRACTAIVFITISSSRCTCKIHIAKFRFPDNFEWDFISPSACWCVCLVIHFANNWSSPLNFIISAILKNADLEKTSSKKVRLELERIFKCDFTARKKEIDTMVMDYVDSTQNDDDDGKSSEAEVEDKKPPPRKAAKKRKAANDSDASSNNDDSGDDYKPERRAAAKKPKKADAGKKKAKGTGRKGRQFGQQQMKILLFCHQATPLQAKQTPLRLDSEVESRYLINRMSFLLPKLLRILCPLGKPTNKK